MKRRALWDALASACDEVSAAFAAYSFVRDTHRRERAAHFAAVAGLQNARLERAVQDYCSALEPIVGVRLAFELHSKYHAVIEALDAQRRLIATLTSTDSRLDGDAIERTDQAIGHALKELQRAHGTLWQALDAAAQRDRRQ